MVGDLELAAARIAQRLCPRCGDPAAPGVQLCPACRELGNERSAAAHATTRSTRRERRRCAVCGRRSVRYRCPRCAFRRKLREVLGGLIDTINTGDSTSAVVHNERQSEGAAHRGGAPTYTPADPGRS